MAVDLTYILTLSEAGDKTFVMPSGFEANVEIHCWGAGGGGFGTGPEDTYQRTVRTRSGLYTGYNGSSGTYSYYTSTQSITVPAGTVPSASAMPSLGVVVSYGPWTKISSGGGSGSGAKGGGGGYAKTKTQVPAGATIRLQVGLPGTDGDRRTGGVGGSHRSYTRYRGGSAGSAYDEDYDMGAGGGGGGASAVVIDGSPVCVAAGGGGAGGPGDDSPIGSQGNPGGVYPGSATDIYPVTLSYAWCQFMNDYAVWGPFSPFTTTINFPVTGTYSFAFAVDNYGNVQVDGVQVVSSSSFTSVTYGNVTINSGTRTVRVFATNTGGPAGVAVRILKPDSSELTNSRNYTVSGGLTNTTDGGTSANGWASGGGGGGGYYGGEAGTTYGDDSGNAPGGNGGQNYGATVEAGSGPTGAGKDVVYFPRTLTTNGTTTNTWTETIINYQAIAGSIVVSSWQVTQGATLVLPPGTIPPGTTLQSDGTAAEPYPGNGSLGLFPVSRSYSIWTPGGSVSTKPVAYIGDAGYPGYIVMVFTRNPGLQIKNPDSSGDWVTIQNSYTKVPTTTITEWTSVPPTTKTFTYGTNDFVIPVGVTEISVTATGGGGGGGGGGYGTGGESSGSGGGGGSGFTTTVSNIAVTPGETLTVVVGAGGAAGSAQYSRSSGGFGGNGGTSTLSRGASTLLTAAGGNGGTGGRESQTVAGGSGFNNGSVGVAADGGAVAGGNGGDSFFTAGARGIASTGGGGGYVGITPAPSGTLGSGGAGGGASNGGGPGAGEDQAANGGAGGGGRITINYSSLPILLTITSGGWKEIQQIYVKNGNVWKSISQRNEIVISNYT